jgi:RNA polymerase-binding transcription factor DksA
MTKEQIEKRKQELEMAKDQLIANIKQNTANLQATIGAIQDCEYWLSLEESEE